MKQRIIGLILAAVLLLAVGCGVGYCIWGYHKVHDGMSIVVLPNGEELQVRSEEITPATSDTSKFSEYTGQGITYYRKVEAVRGMSPFGVPAGEVIAKQIPAQIQTGVTPSVNINPDGVDASAGSATTSKLGGSSWSLWDTVKQWINNAIWWIVIIGAGVLFVFLVLPVLVPASAPIIASLGSGIKWVFALVTPIFGAIWVWVKQQMNIKEAQTQVEDLTTALSQTAKALDAGKTALKLSTSTMTGADAWQIVSDALSDSQDQFVKNLIKELGSNVTPVPVAKTTP